MILIGQYDSPFVRRVGIALKLYDMEFQHQPWSVFKDQQKIVDYNPLIRVPTLVLENGEVLTDSSAILDYLDQVVGADRALYPPSGQLRYRALSATSFSLGAADKAVSLVYEQRLHAESGISNLWVERCGKQITGALAKLESLRSAAPHRFLFSDHIGHADVALACAWRFIMEAHPGLIESETFPSLCAQCRDLEALEVFKSISQSFGQPSQT